MDDTKAKIKPGPIATLFLQCHQSPILITPIHRELAGGRLTTAVLLSFLLRRVDLHRTTKLYFTNEKICQHTSLTLNELRQAKNDLKHSRVVNVSREGPKGLTHYEILLGDLAERLAELPDFRWVDSTQQDTSDEWNPLNTYKDNKEDKIKNHLLLAAEPASTRQRLLRREIWRRMAVALQNAIQSRHQINGASKPNQWAFHFFQLHFTDKIPVASIWKILRWYCHAYQENRPYLPVAESGQSFRDKFSRIRNAWERAKAEEGHDVDSGPRPAVRIIRRQVKTSQNK